MQRLLISIKDAEDDNGAVFFDGKMDGEGEGIDGLDADVIVADGRGGGQPADLLETFNSVLASLAAGILGTPTGAAESIPGGYTSTSGTVYSGLSSFLSTNDPGAPSGYPKAYLNWILLDDQFNYVSGSSGSVATASTTCPANQMNTITAGGPVVMSRNGYLYVWVSNETQGWDVFFDNFSVQYKQGPVLEENHYYPFGLTMAGISDKALKTQYAQNKYRYNGKELQNQEFSDGTGLEEYDYGARFQDPQLGDWHGIDPMADMSRKWSPYAYANDNPLRYIDQDGMNATENDTSYTFTGDDAKWVFNELKSRLDNKSNNDQNGDRNNQVEANDTTKPLPRFVAAPSQKADDFMNQVNSKIVGVAGLMWGTDQVIIAKNYTELVAKIAEQSGFSIAEVSRALSGVSKYLEVGGTITFAVGTTLSLRDAIKHLENHEYGAAGKDGLDVFMGGLGLAGPIGFTISGIYFAVDQTIGWKNAIGVFDLREDRERWKEEGCHLCFLPH